MERLFENQQTLAVFLIFFVPGFISLKIYDLFVASERRDFNKSVLDAVAYSALNFAVLFPLIAAMRSGHLPSFWWYASAFLVLLICPAAWPVILLRMRNWPFFRQRLRNPNARAWDSFFAGAKSYWVIVHLNDGRRIGGVYGVNSFSSNSPAEPEIYLEQVWELDEDGAFIKRIEATAGILIWGETILALEFFEIE
jgi:hypothetical protein